MWDKDPHSGTCFPWHGAGGGPGKWTDTVWRPKTRMQFFNDWPREIHNRETTACIHSTSAKAYRGIDITHRRHCCSTCVRYFRDFIIWYTNTTVIHLLSYYHSFKTRSTLNQVRAGALRSNPRRAVRDAEEESGHSYLVYFFQFLPLLLLQETKRFSSYKITESWFNKRSVNVGRGDGLKASRPADALLWRFKDLARSAETRRPQQSIRFLNYYFTLDVFTRRHPGIFSVMDKSRECGMSKTERHSERPPGDSPARDWAVCWLGAAWVIGADVRENGHPLSPYKIKPHLLREDRFNVNVQICSQSYYLGHVANIFLKK